MYAWNAMSGARNFLSFQFSLSGVSRSRKGPDSEVDTLSATALLRPWRRSSRCGSSRNNSSGSGRRRRRRESGQGSKSAPGLRPENSADILRQELQTRTRTDANAASTLGWKTVRTLGEKRARLSGKGAAALLALRSEPAEEPGAAILMR